MFLEFYKGFNSVEDPFILKTFLGLGKGLLK